MAEEGGMGLSRNTEIERAFAEHWERLFRAARYLLGNEPDAEDLCQAVFAEACRSLDRFAGRSSLYTWLYRIMLNLYYRRLRRLRLERESVTDAGTVTACDPPEPAADAAYRNQALRAAIQALPRIYQTVVVLHYLEGLPASEIASCATLCLPPSKAPWHQRWVRVSASDGGAVWSRTAGQPRPRTGRRCRAHGLACWAGWGTRRQPA